MAKFTDADIDELVNAIRREDGKFAILTGAGCSIEANIPSGTKIAAEICAAYPLETATLSAENKSNYGLCMARIPFAKRKLILEGYLNSDEVKINWANIALACLMDKGLIGRVLTFNFDSILTQACGLLGSYPATYDFGVAPSSKTKYLAEPCLIHLHGQGSGSAMMNTEDETREHAKALEPLLKDTFERFPLIVLGYSGGSDQVFPKIKELYDGEQSLYWLGHSEEPDEHIKEFFKGAHANYCKYFGGVDADDFLIQAAQMLSCFPPKVFADPAGHLLHEMRDVAPYPLKAIGTTDILENTLERLKTNQDTLKFSQNQSADVLDKPENIDFTDTNTTPEIRAWALIRLGNQHYETAKSNNSTTEYEAAYKKYEAALELKLDMHEALSNWGSALNEHAKLLQDPVRFEAAFVKFKDALKINPKDHLVFNNWGIALANLADLQNDVIGYVAAIGKFKEAINIKPDKYEAFYNWATILVSISKLRQDTIGFDAAIDKFKEALKIEPDSQEALYNCGAAALYAWGITKKTTYLDQAIEFSELAEILTPEKCYNGACLAAIKGNETGCEERLLRAKAAKTLPTREHLETDKDLDNMRDKPWFIEFLKGL